MTEKERHVDACYVESNGICANTSRLVPLRGRKSVAATTVPPPELVKSRNICIIRSACSRAHSFQNKSTGINGSRFVVTVFFQCFLRLSVRFSYPPWIALFYSRGFSARTRRRGSIIHHTNSPEAGERAGWHAGTRQRHTFLSWRALLGETHAAHHHRHTADRSRFVLTSSTSLRASESVHVARETAHASVTHIHWTVRLTHSWHNARKHATIEQRRMHQCTTRPHG